MARSCWLSLGLVVAGCLGGTQPQPVTVEGQLTRAKASAAEAHWPEAQQSAVAFWVARCKHSITSVPDCSSTQLIRGEAELATDAPESALREFSWVLKDGDDASREQAQQGVTRAQTALQKVLEQSAGQSWLMVEQDFDDNHKFGPERAYYTLDGVAFGEVTRRAIFSEREHRVVAKAIAPGHHRLAIEIHWKGQGTFDNYLWSSFTPLEIEAPEGGATIATLEVTYTDGGPSNKSVQESFEAVTLR